MAWNAPGKPDNSNNDQQGWKNSRSPDNPPELDEVLRQLQDKLKKLWGKKPPFTPPLKGMGTPKEYHKAIFTFVFGIIFVLWVIAGFFIVDPSEKAAILRFGRYVGTEDPGLHWIPPLIDSKTVINVQQVLAFPYQAEMLTQDENIVSVDLVVQYRINNLRDYLFNVANPNESLQQATASALRQVIGQTKLDDVLTSGRERVREETTQVLENILQRYHTGLYVMDVSMQPAKPPEQVTAAFDDAIKAREDEQRFKNQAISYANQVVPIAQGNAARLFAEAKAYQQQVILKAQGAVAQYLALLPQYQQAPQVTRERMYMDALQSVFAHTPKILLDTPQSTNNMLYLPLAQLLQNQLAAGGSVMAPTANSSFATPPLALPAAEEPTPSVTANSSGVAIPAKSNASLPMGYTIPQPPTTANTSGQGGQQ